jgi:hypothetical protein
MEEESPWQRDAYNRGKRNRKEANPFDDARQEVERRITAPQRLCRLCGKSYFPRNNLGSLQCRYHPGAYRYDIWNCCGQPLPNLPGCVMCDHISTHDNRSEYDLWPKDLLSKVIPKQYLTQFKLSQWTIVKSVKGVEELVAVSRVQDPAYKRPYAIRWIGGR